MVNDQVVILHFSPNQAEMWLVGVQNKSSAVVASRAHFNGRHVDGRAEAEGCSPEIRLALITAENAFAAVAANPSGFVRFAAALDAIVLPQRCLHSPQVQLVDLFIACDGSVGNIDPERHRGLQMIKGSV